MLYPLLGQPLTLEIRGTGQTIPESCWESDDIRTSVAALASTYSNASDVELGRQWGRAALVADNCQREMNKTAEYLGTAFVARDMLSIIESLGEDGLLRYWGNIASPSALGQLLTAPQVSHTAQC